MRFRIEPLIQPSCPKTHLARIHHFVAQKQATINSEVTSLGNIAVGGLKSERVTGKIVPKI